MNSAEIKLALKRKQAEWSKLLKKVERWESYQATGMGSVPSESEAEEARETLEGVIFPSKGAKSSYDAGKRETDHKWQEAVEEVEKDRSIVCEIERKAHGN